ncbi:MAG TPA: OmpA family protein, partial [Tepiditoga sp.]|nr:OmpA family protein [Tepiditoga sp.]
LTKEAKDILYKIGTIILEKTSNEVEIYGYTDDQKTTLDNIYPSNWHLAGARAASVASFFTGEMKNRRSLERIGDVKNGLFDINYFYNSLRFFPISAGDRDILQEIEYLNASNKSEKNILNSKFQNGEITAVELQKSINQLDQSYNNKVEELRNEYRRIDILILKERIR